MTKSKYIKLLWALFGLSLICLFLPYEYGIDYNICDIENMDENCIEVYLWGYETRQIYFILLFNSMMFLSAFSFNSAFIFFSNLFTGFFLLIIFIIPLVPFSGVPITPTQSFGFYISMLSSLSLFIFTLIHLKKNRLFLINKTRSNIIVFFVGTIYLVLFFLIFIFVE
jgi:hypothetical protein